MDKFIFDILLNGEELRLQIIIEVILNFKELDIFKVAWWNEIAE